MKEASPPIHHHRQRKISIPPYFRNSCPSNTSSRQMPTSSGASMAMRACCHFLSIVESMTLIGSMPSMVRMRFSPFILQVVQEAELEPAETDNHEGSDRNKDYRPNHKG